VPVSKMGQLAQASSAPEADAVFEMTDMSNSTESCLLPGSESEDDRVARWRLEQFDSLGFDVVEAALLADSGVDLHRARQLVAAGCPLRTAARILL